MQIFNQSLVLRDPLAQSNGDEAGVQGRFEQNVGSGKMTAVFNRKV